LFFHLPEKVSSYPTDASPRWLLDILSRMPVFGVQFLDQADESHRFALLSLQNLDVPLSTKIQKDDIVSTESYNGVLLLKCWLPQSGRMALVFIFRIQ
jgi:hypothetical protein